MKKLTKLFGIFLVVAVLFVFFPVPTEAATVKLNKTKATIYIGTPYTLKLKGTKIKSVKSSNKKVAVVYKSGKVTGKKEGTATITLKGENGKSYKCKVTIKKPYLNYTSKSIYPGMGFTLKLNGAKVKAIKSSNNQVATVDKEGNVLGKGAGSATITVTGKKGKNYKCTVTVNKPANWKDAYELYVWYDMGEYFFMRVGGLEEVWTYTNQFPSEYRQLLEERYPDREIILNGTGPSCAVVSALYTDPQRGFPIWSIDYIWD